MFKNIVNKMVDGQAVHQIGKDRYITPVCKSSSNKT